MINVPHIIETALLLLVAYLIGCVVGYALRRLTAKPLPLVVDAPAKPADGVAVDAVAPPAPNPAPVPQPVAAREFSPAARLAMASPLEALTPPPIEPAPIAASVVPAARPEAPQPKPAPVQAAPKPASVPKPKPAATPSQPAAKIAAEKTPAAAATVVEPVKAKPPKSRLEAKLTAPIAVPPTLETEPPKTPKPKPAPKPASTPQAKAAPKPVAAKSAPKPPADPKPAGLAAPRAGGKDDLKLLKGIGPKIEQTLNDLGIFHFDQLAKLSKANIDWIEDQLAFKGRIGREAWVEQAKALAKPANPAK